MTAVLTVALTAASVALSAGCVQRTITITSEPQGALVRLNDQEVGRTPVTVPFKFYGTYDVRLELDEYKPLWTKQPMKAPWWEAPGPDLVAEAVGGESHYDWHYVLEPVGRVDEEALVDRAKAMRIETREAVAYPGEDGDTEDN